MSSRDIDADLLSFLECMAHDPLVQGHIRYWWGQWEKGHRSGSIHAGKASHLEMVFEWRGGDLAICHEHNYQMLYQKRESGMLPFDFCTLCNRKSSGGIEYLLLRMDSSEDVLDERKPL